MKNKLGIFGDSFASDEISPRGISGEPWVLSLVKMIDCDYEIHAVSGTSIWWSFQNFLKLADKFSHIVFVYSQHNRWHHVIKPYERFHYLTAAKFQTPKADEQTEKVKNLLLSTYPYVSCEELDLYLYQKIFNDVNDYCDRQRIKLINFLPFDSGNLIDYGKQKGFRVYGAYDLISYEQQNLFPDEKIKFMKMLHSGDLRYCHMNWKNNSLLAKRMFENLENIYHDLNLIDDPDLSNDPECLRELLKFFP